MRIMNHFRALQKKNKKKRHSVAKTVGIGWPTEAAMVLFENKLPVVVAAELLFNVHGIVMWQDIALNILHFIINMN